MKQHFSDRASFLKAAAILRDATFIGRDLVHDEPARTMRLTLTRADAASSRGILGGRRTTWLKTVLTVRAITAYRQSLAAGPDDIYVFDRAEIGRGGQEVALYFRPGDRAVMDVDQIEGTVEDSGRATAPSRSPVAINPLAEQDVRAAPSHGRAADGPRGSRGGRAGK